MLNREELEQDLLTMFELLYRIDEMEQGIDYVITIRDAQEGE